MKISNNVITKECIFEELKKLSNEYKGMRFGLAGSYARGKETKRSDIDIVVDTGRLTIEQILDIKSRFSIKTDVIQLELLKSEDEENDRLMIEWGLPINKNSTYKSINRDVIWCE